MASNEGSETEERLKSALWYQIGQYVDSQDTSNATPQFIGALTELVYTQIANSARDIELFAQHAGRSVVRPDDVLLLGRRNLDVEDLLRAALERIKAEDRRNGADAGTGAEVKKRGRPPGSGGGDGGGGKGKGKKI